jgi:hypothetical protein
VWEETAGTQILPGVIARVMPGGTTWYESHTYNDQGNRTQLIESWVEGGVTKTRTNTWVYEANGLDLKAHVDPLGHVVLGQKWHATTPHLLLQQTNAVGEVTVFTWDTVGGAPRLQKTRHPSGLITSNAYGGDGYVSRTVDYFDGVGPVRTNLYTWATNRVQTHVDARSFSRTNYYDPLNRPTRVDYADGSNEEHYYFLWPGEGTFAGGTGTTNLRAHPRTSGTTWR